MTHALDPCVAFTARHLLEVVEDRFVPQERSGITVPERHPPDAFDDPKGSPERTTGTNCGAVAAPVNPPPCIETGCTADPGMSTKVILRHESIDRSIVCAISVKLA